MVRSRRGGSCNADATAARSSVLRGSTEVNKEVFPYVRKMRTHSVSYPPNRHAPSEQTLRFRVGLLRNVCLLSVCLLGWGAGVLSWGTIAVAQSDPEAETVPSATAGSNPASPVFDSDGLYFADVLVRGRPVFQVGSVADIDAAQRAEVINRRIASVLSRTDTVEPITVQPIPDRDLATLQLNDRVLMTVTEQDARDFGVTVDALARDWAGILDAALEKPPLAVDVTQRLGATLRQTGRSLIDNLPALIGAILLFFVTWIVASGVRYIAFTWAQKTEGDRSTEVLIGRLGYGGIWVLGSVLVLGVMGLDFGALLGALGLTSVAIGFSLKDVLSNYISGVILLAARPFRIGDQVVIAGYEGTITQVQLRATTLKTYDGRTIYIPNQEVFQASITNNTASPYRRTSVIVGIDYDADIGETKRVILQTLEKLDVLQHQPEPQILVSELAASTVNLEVRFWVDSQRVEFLEATSLAAQTIKEALRQANIEMPTEIYTLLFRDPSAVQPPPAR